MRGRDVVGEVFRKAFAKNSFEQTWNEIERLGGDDFMKRLGSAASSQKAARRST